LLAGLVLDGSTGQVVRRWILVAGHSDTEVLGGAATTWAVGMLGE